MLGQLAAIGIVKGKSFAPDERMKNILVDAAAVANATARALSFNGRDRNFYFYPNQFWYSPGAEGSYLWERDGARSLDARTGMFYIATGVTPAMFVKMVGVGSQYAIAALDADKSYLNGGKNYKLHLPPNVPVKTFWSVVVYDPQTRSELQTDSRFPSVGSQSAGIERNADSSYDVHFGPTAPAGKEKHWIQTVPGKGFFLILRLYGPLPPWFDKTWRPGDIQLVRGHLRQSHKTVPLRLTEAIPGSRSGSQCEESCKGSATRARRIQTERPSIQPTVLEVRDHRARSVRIVQATVTIVEEPWDGKDCFC